MSADMEGLRRKGHAIAERLTAGDEARITCPNGSDLRLGLGEREAIPDAGELTHDGAFGNLPCGEGFIAPIEGTATGRLVVDGTIASVGIPQDPVELTVEDGHLRTASGEEGERLVELLTAHGDDGTNVAELGIGTNEKAKLTGNVLEDEKILGTAHVAFGASAAIGGTVQVPVHLDCVVVKPDVEVDGEPIVRSGELRGLKWRPCSAFRTSPRVASWRRSTASSTPSSTPRRSSTSTSTRSTTAPRSRSPARPKRFGHRSKPALAPRSPRST